MPVLEIPDYTRPKLLFNRHFETIIPGLFRKVSELHYTRERINTPDGDFLDLDWHQNGQKRLVVVSHGLEGDSNRPYVQGMVRAFGQNEWDVLAWNYRGCSGEMNRLPVFYHSGATHDLETVINHVIHKNEYQQIVLIGFSLGGNLTLKYLGESKTEKFKEIKGAVVFSVPLDLAGCSMQIDKPYNFLYSRRFLSSLKKKVRVKSQWSSWTLNTDNLDMINSIYQFDDQVTAPLHGFDNADHYYDNCSSRKFLNGIQVNTLVVNALNDPFLSSSCLDQSLFTKLNNVFFETPKQGGHCGFARYNGDSYYWSELRALKFIETHINLTN